MEIGSKPLIMRTDPDLDSELVTVLRPGQLVKVRQIMDLEDGKLCRALVEQVEEEAAARAIADSWWSPFDPSVVDVDGTEQGLVSSRYAVPAASQRSIMSGHDSSSDMPTGSLTSSQASTFQFLPTVGLGAATRGFLQPPPPPSVQGSITSTAIVAIGGSLSPPGARSKFRSRGPLCGWVTLIKEGTELVAQRPRLNAGERRKHMELWARRDAADRAFKSQLNHHVGSSKEKNLVGPSLAHEIVADRSGIGFAFGGMHPGTLHAAGRLVKVHSIRYTIGRAGKYKLHVGLRNQAVALPGSPFDLLVGPSNAHAPSTMLPKEALPLTGVVGDAWTCNCTLHVSDRMGNRCVAGGAPILVDVDNPEIESQVHDNDNGSYTLEWRGKIAGTYKTQVRIDGAHVLGSPCIFKLFSGPPDVPKCEIAGAGLRNALAGQSACVYITCKDNFSNQLSANSIQGNALSFGLALMPPATENKTTRDTVPSMDFDGSWVKSEEHDGATGQGESFEIRYTAKEAGDFELHVWCDPDAKGVRQWLTGSPFNVRVTGVRPSAEGSYVGGVEKLLNDPVTAGDSLTLRPQLRDQFGNASAAEPGTFAAHIDCPDGLHELEVKQVKGLGLYEVNYDVSIKGPHSIHFLLNGADITGSPVEFNVNPSAALGSKSKLYPPADNPVIHSQCELLLEAIDKFGNKLETGGCRIDARVGGAGISTISQEDHDNGTYTISFSAAVVGETRVTVRLDNVEMAPLKLSFVAADGGEGGGKKGKKGKEEAKAAEVEGPAAADITDS